MKMKIKLSIKLAAWSFSLVLFSLYSVTPTFARNANNPISSGKDAGTVVSLTKHIPAVPTKAGASGSPAVRFLLVSRDGKTLTREATIKLMAKVDIAVKRAAALTSPQELDGWGSCLRHCMKDAGVNEVTLIMCGGQCVFGGVILCALCVGIDVTVVEWCALGCAAYPVISTEESAR